jgi:hypothetical protein
MTHWILNIAIAQFLLLAVLASPPLRSRFAPRIRRYTFASLVVTLWVFSLHETISESGAIAGIAFSIVPLVAGAVALRSWLRHGGTTRPHA